MLCIFIFLDIFIGFSQRSQTVSEGAGTDDFLLTIDVHSKGSERRDFELHIRVIGGNATVEGTNVQFDSSYDALFGSREDSDDPVTEIRNLEAGQLQLSQHLTTSIKNDNHSEGLECFTLEIRNPDVSEHRDTSTCNAASTNSSDYFCEHTICIEDDEGMYS